jgi:hypothetical protein
VQGKLKVGPKWPVEKPKETFDTSKTTNLLSYEIIFLTFMLNLVPYK